LPVALRLANQRIRQAAQGGTKKHNMGTTAVAVYMDKEKTFVAHAGDSRGYLYRDGKIWAITADHSLLGEFIRSQHPSAEEIAAFPYKNVINRALGPAVDVKVDARLVEMNVGDTLLLCCDGLHGMISDETMAQLLQAHPNLEEACRSLVDAANAAGGSDNITVVLVRRH
jgi:protein phosphatase